MIADRISTIARNTIVRKTKNSRPSTMPQIQDLTQVVSDIKNGFTVMYWIEKTNDHICYTTIITIKNCMKTHNEVKKPFYLYRQ